MFSKYVYFLLKIEISLKENDLAHKKYSYAKKKALKLSRFKKMDDLFH